MTKFQTKLIHADEKTRRVSDVVQPINVSTTFSYDKNPDKLIPADQSGDVEGWVASGNPIYSRLSHPNSEAVEAIFDSIFDHPTVVYNSGLAAFNALLTHVNPKRLFFDKCYHGCHGVADIFTRTGGLKQHGLTEKDLKAHLQKGDLIHIETPVNPEGTSYDIEYFATIAHEKGAILSVDSTFAPFPLQDPFKFGADIVMHSATKFYGGHSDLLAGLLIVKDSNTRHQLLEDRIYLATNISNFDSFLLNRSLRTYDLRIRKQSENCEKLVKFLSDNVDQYNGILTKVHHSSLQSEPFIKKQLPNGYGPVFSIIVKDVNVAKTLPSKLHYFYHATSLGGVESLIEWRALSSASTEKTLLRVSVGIENIDDLIADFDQALKSFGR